MFMLWKPQAKSYGLDTGTSRFCIWPVCISQSKRNPMKALNELPKSLAKEGQSSRNKTSQRPLSKAHNRALLPRKKRGHIESTGTGLSIRSHRGNGSPSTLLQSHLNPFKMLACTSCPTKLKLEDNPALVIIKPRLKAPRGLWKHWIVAAPCYHPRIKWRPEGWLPCKIIRALQPTPFQELGQQNTFCPVADWANQPITADSVVLSKSSRKLNRDQHDCISLRKIAWFL